ncbi:MAG: ArsR family transcriptional regulator [Thermodesulfobacteriota bacterium]
MKVKIKKPPVPVERHDTVRHEIMSLLVGQPFSAREISAELRISEKEVLYHLEHIRMAIRKGKEALLITPPACKKCGFEFRKRERLTKPGKCPVCRSEQIQEPRFSIS